MDTKRPKLKFGTGSYTHNTRGGMGTYSHTTIETVYYKYVKNIGHKKLQIKVLKFRVVCKRWLTNSWLHDEYREFEEMELGPGEEHHFEYDVPFWFASVIRYELNMTVIYKSKEFRASRSIPDLFSNTVISFEDASV
ncbi:MAG TPA: hypothetical protein VEZ40_22230 [Pyrinomonadaceae bacterium]|nr:hypothetical protein [Pyrinomonadaceae bacterium]